MLQSFQSSFFAELERRKKGAKSLGQILMEQLNVSKSAAYKKLNGQSPLLLEEALLLAARYDISLDHCFQPHEGQVIIQYPALEGGPMTPHRFVDLLLSTLAQLDSAPGLEVRYSTSEIPIFNYLYFPELTALKLYIYSHSVWRYEGVKAPGQPWIDALIEDVEFQQKREGICNIMAKTPTEEFYRSNMLDSTLGQIRFARLTGQISPSFAEKVLNQIQEMLAGMAEWAAKGIKKKTDGSLGAHVEMHVNDLLFTNVVFLTKNDQGRRFISTYDSPNFIVCTDERVLERQSAWFDSLKSKTSQISAQNESGREMFFSSLQQRVANCLFI